MQAPIPQDEPARIAALRAFDILDTAPEHGYDDLVRLAAQICGTPTALMSFVDTDRQWFKAKVGLAGSEAPRETAFCAHAILDSKTLVVPDAVADRRFADNPFVTGDPYIRFYAGAPLETGDGYRLGTLCAVDQVPRQLEPGQLESLAALARQASHLLEARRVAQQLARALEDIRTLKRLLPICAGCKRIRDEAGTWTEIETYVSARTDSQFSHGICPTCTARLYPE